MPLKVNVNFPLDKVDQDEFVAPEAVSQIALTSERAGYHSILVTDHPCPTGRWLDAGGHHSHDVFVLLSFIAAATRTLRLQTGTLVLPYRNPFLTARAVSTLDVLSKGRVSLSVGAGYLKGEYRALGVNFDQRNELSDEYILAMKAAWTSHEFTFAGTGYEALGNRILPQPHQKPHPPILIAGNSKRAIRRAVELGDTWNPFFAQGVMAATSRTAELTGEQDLADALDYMRAHCEKIGRTVPPEIDLCEFEHLGASWQADALLERAAKLETLGVSAISVHFNASTRSEWCESAERFGSEFVAKLT